ncbi:hypothetical protein MMC10_001941 [Thelotrema lepadinum]|nr:hypothetical protein [Thelotrema lepadinum]
MNNQAASSAPAGTDALATDDPKEEHKLDAVVNDLKKTTTSGSTREAFQADKSYNLHGRSHYSIKGHYRFNLAKSGQRATIARDWPIFKKRVTAAVACVNTGVVGLVLGIYAGEVPALQYAVIDENHYTILGNFLFFIGLAIPTFFLYSLPILHGRRPYTLAALAIMLPLQFPPAIIVMVARSGPDAGAITGLLLTRFLSGLAMSFASLNSLSTLLDLFGSSLMSGNPHQEVVIQHDPRRHGGGMGVWLGIWTWSFMGSLAIGFLIGACIVSGNNVAWGFWAMVILSAVVLFFNIVTPETRKAPFRRSMAEVQMPNNEVSRRVGRGEMKMHLYSTGPRHWWEEVSASLVLNLKMLKQPGFLILALYQGWMYGQFVIVIILLGALVSRDYRFQPQYVGLCIVSLPVGALMAVPFEKASFFSRARHHPPRTDSMTFEKRFTWTSHLIRRAIFMLLLPFAGLAYTLTSGGPPIHVSAPCIFAGLIGFLSNLALSECAGLIMETFDTSDLQPGMTGRRRSIVPQRDVEKRTNYSCYPRVTSGLMISQAIGFIIAAAATATGGNIVRAIGAQAATAIMAGVLLVLTILLIAALTRYKSVQVVPTNRVPSRLLAGPGEEWMPVIIGNPSGTTRRISLLEEGAMTRWSEIRRRNKLLASEGAASLTSSAGEKPVEAREIGV